MKSFSFVLGLMLGIALLTKIADATPMPPLPAASSAFTVGSLHVAQYGTPNKPTLIFIPGLTCGPWEWAGEIRALAPNYDIYALTLPGFDGQPAIQTPLFPTVTSDFWKLLRDRNITKPVVIGHSLGGTTGIMLAEQHSNLLRAVIALDGMPVFPGLETMAADQRAAAVQQAVAGLGSITSPEQFAAVEQQYVLGPMITSKDDIAAAAALTAKSDPKASGEWLQEDVKLDLRTQLGAVAVPLLEIAPFDPTLDPLGPGKFATAAAKQAYYASLLSGDATAQVKMIQPSRHFAMYDQPQQLHALIVSFLNAVLKAGSSP